MRSKSNSERGSILPLLAIVLVVVLATIMSIVAAAGHSARVAKVQWAADASALAAAGAGPDGDLRAAARSVAAGNGARLVSLTSDASPASGPPIGPEMDRVGPVSFVVVAEVEFDGITARASAARFTVPRP